MKNNKNPLHTQPVRTPRNLKYNWKCTKIDSRLDKHPCRKMCILWYILLYNLQYKHPCKHPDNPLYNLRYMLPDNQQYNLPDKEFHILLRNPLYKLQCK